MSIALVTKGRLWPVGGGRTIREQFTNIESTIEDPQQVVMEMQEMVEVTSEVDMGLGIQAEVEVTDSVTEDVETDTEVSGTVEEC